MQTDRIERTITIAASRERVWSLLTEGEHLGRWFGDAGATVDLRPGGALTMAWKEHGSTTARIEVVEPLERFAFRWEAPAEFAVDGADALSPGSSTLVEFTLTPVDDGTRVAVVESGFAALAGSADAQETYRTGNVEGWIHETAQLAQYAMDLPG